MKKFGLVIFIIPFFLISCKNDIYYEKMDSIKNEVWSIDNKLVYEFEIKDSMEFYDIYFNVRNTIDYPYQNLYIFLTNQFPSGIEIVDTLGCVLCDPFGKWYGKGDGRIKENKFLLRKKVRFQHKGKYVFTVQQAMRNEQLEGIASFGLTFEHSKKNKTKK
jgi:gliding motility-associated lipoprotein GldH